MQCIDLSEIVHIVKDDIIVTSVHLKLLHVTLFVVTHLLSSKVSPKWRLNLGFAFIKLLEDLNLTSSRSIIIVY